jgi:glycosyltransferase involved in cell wall biosynthesis
MKADYLALERGGLIWDKSDYLFQSHRIPFLHALREFSFFWRIVSKYEIIHSHFAMMLTASGWEYPLLKKMGRKIVVHYRGCEVRNREKNMALHPEVNICQQCDYNASICRDPVRMTLVRRAQEYGDLFLVTTPDMKDFVPSAIHFPFFLPQIDYTEYARFAKERPNPEEIKIVHVTGHPGLEGTNQISQAIEHLKAKGYCINFVFLSFVNHEQVLREIASADLTIGKMKMGYYAYAQLESMYLGVPAITWVRPEFMTDELQNSGFIFCALHNLEETLEYYLSHPQALEEKRKIARTSIMELHSNERLGRRLIGYYEQIKATANK